MTEQRAQVRVHQRFPLTHPVHFVAGGEIHSAMMSNIGEGGLGAEIAGHCPFSSGLIILAVSLPTAESTWRSFSVPGEIVWRDDARIGVRFVEPGQPFIKTLRRFVDRYFQLASSADLHDHIRMVFFGQD